jgi:hypothetical protein
VAHPLSKTFSHPQKRKQKLFLIFRKKIGLDALRLQNGLHTIFRFSPNDHDRDKNDQ